jgi:lysyl endopeptidase
MRRTKLWTLLAMLTMSAPALAQQKIGEVVETFVLDSSQYEEAQALDGGRTLRRYAVRSPGASFVKLYFGTLDLAADERLTLLDGDGRPLETYTGRGPSGTGSFWSLSSSGDIALLHYETTGRGFFSVDAHARGEAELGTASVCPGTGNDFTGVACAGSLKGTAASLTEQLKGAVGHIRFVQDGGVYMCTGSAVTPWNHFLTNEHCFANHSQAQCDSYEVYFEYENASCSATSGTRGTALRCAQLLKYNATLDYALLRLNAYPGTHAELSGRNLAKGEYVFIVQHPSGYPKKVAEDKVLLPVVDGRGKDTDFSYQVETLGGSSGSPVFDANGDVVGLHHFGGCSTLSGNQGVRMALILPEIQHLLVPSTEAVRIR